MENLLQQIAVHFATIGINDNRCHVLMKGSEAPNIKNGVRLFEDKEMVELEKVFHKHLHYAKYSCEVDGVPVYFEGSSYQSADKFKRWVVFERIHLNELPKIKKESDAAEHALHITHTSSFPKPMHALLFMAADRSTTFMNDGNEMLKLLPSGEILVGGKPVGKDIEVVEALRKFLHIK